jgi:Protein of unknown function (DUF2975)
MTAPVLAKVRRLCWLVRAVALTLLASVLVLYLGTWAFPDLGLWDQHWARMARIGALPADAARTLAGSDRFLVGAVCLPYLIALVWAFRHLGLMLRGFERGEFFERATVAHLRAFAGFLLLAKGLSLIANHVRVGLFAPLVGLAHGRISFNISSDELALLLLCALIFLIAHLMEEGNRLAEENRSFL